MFVLLVLVLFVWFLCFRGSNKWSKHLWRSFQNVICSSNCKYFCCYFYSVYTVLMFLYAYFSLVYQFKKFPASLKLWPYGTVQICLLLFYDPSTQFPGMYKNQSGMNLTSPPSSQNCHAVRWHCTAESKRWVAEIKSWFLCCHPADQQACNWV